MTDMTTETTTATGSGQDTTAEEKINQLRKLFANAPEVGRTALDLSELRSQARDTGPRFRTRVP
jgi:hypothetical protein